MLPGMKKVLFYGDSNTYGYDPAGFMGGRYPRSERWTTILQESLADTWEIASDGMPGRALPTTVYEWDYIRSVIRQETPLDVFAVMLGTNDLLVSGGRDYAVIYREEGEKLAEYYEELAGYRQTLFADASKWELGFAFDGVHLSEQGHARFAAEMAEVLNKIGKE